ncbi:Poly-beta-1,6-N-acetyl-D-glucosamine synthase [Pseudobythopirellula maris]|uniref:Poly-beta-1,6-N-acetyl-D-glucosamine synthase n=1 Tax=Pseudobythopirellula maris TaxID=2527991 RepID=A0A5C5ZJX2_9BACT|nr:glycosyltransferase family 2 protein [Pseudobythopirellula maris]TWT87510.1 Poly-beta-1,6-N-acetyl-D-glucosamine synthase [Pseudobythopirellula maris]
MLIFVGWSVATLCIVPSLVLAAECLAAMTAPRPQGRNAVAPQADWADSNGQRPRLGVLIPAHNEELVLRDTLRSLRPQLLAGDRCLVVADNCEDSTALIAEQEGAEVLVRNDSQRRGKGWALDAGRNAFRDSPPEVLIIVDADTRAEPGALDRLVRAAHATDRPVQATYLMPSATQGGADGVSAFAWTVRNLVRPLGLHRMGLPCLLNGSGMALPWRLADRAPLAGGHIGEEYKLAVDLALTGSPPVFCPEAVVLGTMPNEQKVAVAQRRRWSHSHLEILRTSAPRLLARFLTSMRIAPLTLALDLAVPPLILLLACHLVAITLFAAMSYITPAVVTPLAATVASLLLSGVSILAAWRRFGGSHLPSGQSPSNLLLAAPRYVLLHAPHYLSYFGRRHTEWTKTPRDTPTGVEKTSGVGQ